MKQRAKRSAQLTLLALIAAGSGPGAALEMHYDGCTEVLATPACVLPESATLSVWVDALAAGDIRFRVGSTVIVPQSIEPRDGGLLVTLRVAPVDQMLHLESLRQSGERTTLALLAPRAQPQVAQANALLASGDNDAAVRFVDDTLAGADDSERAELWRTRGRALGRLGDVDGAQASLRMAVDLGRQYGQLYSALRAAGALAFSLVHNGRQLSAAREVLQGFDAHGLGHAPSRYFRSHYLALVAFNDGDARTHLRLFADAARQARRFDWPRRELNSDSLLAVQWQRLGQRERALALLDGWRDRLPEDMPACERALFWTNLGWSHLLALEAGEATLDPTRILERARSEVGASCGVAEQVNADINLALSHWHAGRIDMAGAALERARALTDAPPLHLVFWAYDVEARVALARDDAASAVALYQQLSHLAQATGAPATRWRASIGLARALTAMGLSADALDAYAQAEDQLDADVLRVPLTEGRETLLATRDLAQADHLGLLLDQARHEDAFALARRQRTRLVRSAHVSARLAALDGAGRLRWDSAAAHYQALRESLAQQRVQSWALPADALQAMLRAAAQQQATLREVLDDAVSGLPPPPELTSPVLPANALFITLARSANRWAAFAWDGAAVEVSESHCAGSSPSSVAACALAPLAQRIATFDALVLAPPAALSAVDFHALDLGGAALIDLARVSYAADLGRSPAALPNAGVALLVADPHGNLGAARAEVAATAESLRASSNWRVEIVAGSDAAQPRVLGALDTTDLFHFAGHAMAGDAGRWDGALLLASDTQLGVGDILTLSSTPSLVVLSGCETAAAAGAPVPVFSLASAFLANGSDAVIATSRSVDDASAHALTLAFYASFASGMPFAQAFHQAQRQLRADPARPDWAAFRLLLP